MDADWSSLSGIDPRALELAHDVSPATEESPRLQTSQIDLLNATSSDRNHWSDGPALRRSFVPIGPLSQCFETGAFDIDKPALDGILQKYGTVAGSYNDDPVSRPMCSVLDLCPDEESQLFDEEFPDAVIDQFSTKDGFRQAHTVTSSVSTSKGFLAQMAKRFIDGPVRPPGNLLSRSMTLQTGASLAISLPQNRVTVSPDILHCKRQKREVTDDPSKVFPTRFTGHIDASRTHTAKFQEAIALVQESIKSFSPFSRRKAADLIHQVAELVNQLNQLVIEEAKYGNSSSDGDIIRQSGATSLSQDSKSTSNLVDVKDEMGNTSVSSTPRQPVQETEELASLDDYQHISVHPPCSQCGIKSLYYCTREDCIYTTHSLAEWKRHEESQKHSQQERFICLACPTSPPPVDSNGDSVCEFCRKSFPVSGAILRAHYLQCQRAQRSCKTYGRKDRLITHLRSHPGVSNVSHLAAAGKYTVNSKWPRQCGFCGVLFKTWDERMDHIPGHFQDGLDLSSWKLSLLGPEDFCQRSKQEAEVSSSIDPSPDVAKKKPELKRASLKRIRSNIDFELEQETDRLGPDDKEYGNPDQDRIQSGIGLPPLEKFETSDLKRSGQRLPSTINPCKTQNSRQTGTSCSPDVKIENAAVSKPDSWYAPYTSTNEFVTSPAASLYNWSSDYFQQSGSCFDSSAPANEFMTSHPYDCSSFQQTDTMRHTPNSLEWGTKGIDFVRLYKFIVPKGKQPYFQLLDEWTPTYETPLKVYLDEAKIHNKNHFPCQYPGCSGKQTLFSRPADLERHYKNVHSNVKDSFPCDYRKCLRSQDPFTRKDHYRDHLRDYHKEDIGCAKGEKSSRNKDKQKWQRAQKIWLAERYISHKHWRCNRCLVKNYVTQGWECSSCKNPCEEDRIRARKQVMGDPAETTMEDPAETSTEDGYAAAAPSCGACNGGTWIENEHGGYASCPVCQFTTAESFPLENNVAYY